MLTESAQRLGPTAIMFTGKPGHPQKLSRSLWQRVNVPRRHFHHVFKDHGRGFATLEYPSARKSRCDSVEQFYTDNFGKVGLNLSQSSESTNYDSNIVGQSPIYLQSLLAEKRVKNLQALARLRQAKVLGDVKVFRQTFVIRSYEVSSDGKTSIDTVVSLFQEVAINHFSFVGLGGAGFGATPKMNLYRLIWVITKLHVEVDRYPTWPEAIYVDSWTKSAGRNGMIIEWLLREHETGEIIGRGTSTWAMMNQDTRRLSKLPDDVRAEIQPTFVTDERRAVADALLERVPKLDNTAKHITTNLRPAKADLDGNNHVNNITYIRWIMESVPRQTWDSHEISRMTLEYRRECQEADVVESLTNLEALEPTTDEDNHMPSLSDDKHFIHLLRMQGKGDEIVRGRTVWQERK